MCVGSRLQQLREGWIAQKGRINTVCLILIGASTLNERKRLVLMGCFQHCGFMGLHLSAPPHPPPLFTMSSSSALHCRPLTAHKCSIVLLC